MCFWVVARRRFTRRRRRRRRTDGRTDGRSVALILATVFFCSHYCHTILSFARSRLQNITKLSDGILSRMLEKNTFTRESISETVTVFLFVEGRLAFRASYWVTVFLKYCRISYLCARILRFSRWYTGLYAVTVFRDGIFQLLSKFCN